MDPVKPSVHALKLRQELRLTTTQDVTDFPLKSADSCCRHALKEFVRWTSGKTSRGALIAKKGKNGIANRIPTANHTLIANCQLHK